jgi:HAD superfamily hydrolase (TIGR01509 family)
MACGVLFDIDGTLVDTNYLHVVAWADAFRSECHDVAMSQIHGLIGQGSDRLVESVLGHDDDAVVDAHADIYGARLHELRAFNGAGELLRRTKRDGLAVVLATSASSHDVQHLRKAIDADEVIDHITTNDDADASKPDPDIVTTALVAADLVAADSVFVGDSVWDVKAAGRAGLQCVCVLTGGIDAATLREAGAAAIYDDVAGLLAAYDDSLLADLGRRNRSR